MAAVQNSAYPLLSTNIDDKKPEVEDAPGSAHHREAHHEFGEQQEFCDRKRRGEHLGRAKEGWRGGSSFSFFFFVFPPSPSFSSFLGLSTLNVRGVELTRRSHMKVPPSPWGQSTSIDYLRKGLADVWTKGQGLLAQGGLRQGTSAFHKFARSPSRHHCHA